MFQTKSFLSITASMINRMRATTARITDFSVGGVARTMIEAPAQEIDELYQMMIAGLVEAVPVSVYRSFDFTKLAAASAGGLVRVSISAQAAQVIVPSGTVFSQPFGPVTYASTADGLIPPGNTFVDVPVVATTTGGASNLGSGVAFTLSNTPALLLAATNLNAFISGRDLETDDQLKTRFNDFIQTLSRSTVDAIAFGARDRAFLLDTAGNQVERVVSVKVVEPYLLNALQPVGLVLLYVHNGSGATSPALVARVVEILHGYYLPDGTRVPGYKAAGVQVNVSAATETPVPIMAVLTARPGYLHADLVAAATLSIASYLLLLGIGEPAVMAEVVTLAMEVPGTGNFILAPGQVDVAAPSSVKLMPGLFTIT